MQSPSTRTDSVYVFTVDPVLAADVYERLTEDPRTSSFDIVVPQAEAVEENNEIIARMARRTGSARLIILDVRSHTLPRLQHVFNQAVGLNRMDLNRTCFTLLIGDGPVGLFEPNKGIEVFMPLLANMRNDYWAAGYFYDPFLHYTHDEKFGLTLDSGIRLPSDLPKRLAKSFRDDMLTISGVRRYFRAVGTPPAKRPHTRHRRIARLRHLFKQRLKDAFGDDYPRLKPWLGKEGLTLTGEPLRLLAYPLYFEEWVADLVAKAKRAPNMLRNIGIGRSTLPPAATGRRDG